MVQLMNLAAEECVKSKSGKSVPEVYTFRNADDAGRDIMNILKSGDTVLVKGSRSMRMEKIVGRISHAV